MTFRVRMALVVFAVTALTMGSAFGAVWWRFVGSQRAQLDDALLAVAEREVSEVLTGQLEFTDAPGPSANAVGPLPKYGVLYDVDGRPITRTENFGTTPASPHVATERAGFDFEHDGVPMRGVVVPVGSTGRRVLLATTRLDFEEDAAILGRAMTVAFAVGSSWAAAVAFAVASWLTREHRRLGVVARRVAEGDTSARVAFRARDADLQRLADDLNVMIERLVGLVAAQDRFVAHAAHELRTPLTALRIELESVLRTGGTPAEYAEAVEGALGSAKRLSALAEDLLQLARAKAERVDETGSLRAAVEAAVAEVAPLGRDRDVRIVAPDATPHVRVGGPERSVARIFRNLLENALRFAPPSSEVRVTAREDGDRVVVTVEDDGPGIPEGEEELVFAPFARGAGDGEGTGLGLTIARGLARSLGGDVVVRPGPGAVVTVSLPIAPGDEVGAIVPSQAAPHRVQGRYAERA